MTLQAQMRPGSIAPDAGTEELLRAFRDLDALLGRDPARAADVEIPWLTPTLLQFIDLAVKHKLWLLADHMLTNLARRGRLRSDQKQLAARVRNLKATLFVQVPQVTADSPFGGCIRNLVQQMRPSVIFDIGAATGLGTTHCFSEAATVAGVDCTIYAMESEPVTYELLRKNTAGMSNVRALLSALVTDQDVPPWETLLPQLRAAGPIVQQFPDEEIHGWYVHGLELLRRLRLDGRAPFAELPAKIDIAMIDADLFFAREELQVILGRTAVVLLDDICAFKNQANHAMLAGSREWEMLEHHPEDRHGWSAFRRK